MNTIGVNLQGDKLASDCLDAVVAFPIAVRRMRDMDDISSIPDQMQSHTMAAFMAFDAAGRDCRVIAATVTDRLYRNIVSLQVLDEFTRHYAATAIKEVYDQLGARRTRTFYILDNSLREDRFLAVIEVLSMVGVTPFSPNTHGGAWTPIEQKIRKIFSSPQPHIAYIEPDAAVDHLDDAVTLAKSLEVVATFRNQAPSDDRFNVLNLPKAKAKDVQESDQRGAASQRGLIRFLGSSSESAMFSIFKKRKQIHEPVELQRREVLAGPMGPFAVSGEDCDEITGATGPFGHSYANPIPVNGQLGTYKYLTKLRSSAGLPLLFHRLGSMASPASKYSVDVYEVVSSDGKFWDVLFFEMYHPRRSNNAPSDYTLTPFNERTGDEVFGLGVDVYCPNFPYDLPDAIIAHNGFEQVSKLAREAIGVTTHLRPNQHKNKVVAVSTRLEGRRAWQPFKPSA